MSSKLTDLVEITTPSADDLIYIVDGVGTTPASKKIKYSNLMGTAAGFVPYTGATADVALGLYSLTAMNLIVDVGGWPSKITINTKLGEYAPDASISLVDDSLFAIRSIDVAGTTWAGFDLYSDIGQVIFNILTPALGNVFPMTIDGNCLRLDVPIVDATGANKNSIDTRNRYLYASDGTDIILDWNTSGTANFNNSNLTTTGTGTFGSLVVDTTTLVVNASGYADMVGIGTATPATRFHLAGTTSSHYGQIDTGLNFDFVNNPMQADIGLALVAEAGNVNAGLHYYTITYYTAFGETGGDWTGFTFKNITTDAGHGKVTVTVPVSTDYRVTGRRIYRTKADGYFTATYLLADIANNTETTYLDNTADAGLGAAKTVFFLANTTNRMILADGGGVMLTDIRATILGSGAGATAFNGTLNTGGLTAVGYRAGTSITTGDQNTLIGDTAGQYMSDGTSNVAVGMGAISGANANYSVGVGRNALATGGYGSVAVGMGAGFYNNGIFNVFVGIYAGSGISAMSGSNYNVGMGYYSLYNLGTNDSNNVALGTNSGRYETGSNALYIDSLDRTNEATGKIQSLIYGQFNASVASQQLTVNAGTLNFRAGVDTDLTVNFLGTSNSGLLNWMEDEDYFKFSDDIFMNSSERLYFYNTNNIMYGDVANLRIFAGAAFYVSATGDAGYQSAGNAKLNSTAGSVTVESEVGITYITADHELILSALGEEIGSDGIIYMDAVGGIDMTGDVVINGSLTYDSSDPIVETFYPTTRTTAIDLARNSTPSDKFGGGSIYFNKDTSKLELYDQKSGKVFEISMVEVERKTPWSADRKEISKFKFDKLTGNVEETKKIVRDRGFRIKDTFKFDNDTGKFLNSDDHEVQKETAIESISQIGK